MIGLPSLPVHSTPTSTPTPGIEAASGDLIALGITLILSALFVVAAVAYLQSITGGRWP